MAIQFGTKLQLKVPTWNVYPQADGKGRPYIYVNDTILGNRKTHIGRTSIIIPCRNEGLNLLRTLESIMQTADGHDYEIIVVDDGSTDGSGDIPPMGRESNVRVIRGADLGVARARNRGAADATGDILLFHDGHMTHEHKWLDEILEALRYENVHAVSPAILHSGEGSEDGHVHYGGTWDRWLVWTPIRDRVQRWAEIPFCPGGCLAVKRGVFENTGGFGTYFRGWGYEDQEFCLRLWLRGYRALVTPYTTVTHLLRPKQYHIDSRQLHRNYLALVIPHLAPGRLVSALESRWKDPDLANALVSISLDGIWEERREQIACRLYDDLWFVDRFGMTI